MVFNGLKKGSFERFKFKGWSPNLSELTNWFTSKSSENLWFFDDFSGDRS